MLFFLCFSLPGGQILPDLIFLFSFLLPSFVRIFLVVPIVRNTLPKFSSYFVRIVPYVDIVFVVFMGEGEHSVVLLRLLGNLPH